MPSWLDGMLSAEGRLAGNTILYNVKWIQKAGKKLFLAKKCPKYLTRPKKVVPLQPGKSYTASSP